MFLNMDWTTIITAAIGGLLGSGGMSLYNRRANKKKAEAEADITASEEWHRLYDEQHARNAELSAKVDALTEQNMRLQLENQDLRHQITRNTEDIDELRREVRRLGGSAPLAGAAAKGGTPKEGGAA